MEKNEIAAARRVFLVKMAQTAAKTHRNPEDPSDQ